MCFCVSEAWGPSTSGNRGEFQPEDEFPNVERLRV